MAGGYSIYVNLEWKWYICLKEIEPETWRCRCNALTAEPEEEADKRTRVICVYFRLVTPAMVTQLGLLTTLCSSLNELHHLVHNARILAQRFHVIWIQI